MRERAIAPTNDPAAEAIATTGLFLIFTAIIAVAVCLASWGSAETMLAAVAGVTAMLSFAASLVCFGIQSRDS
ncbi:hypothetical protein [Mycobacterium sp. E740]|uniref:hypothetical protein n=1 Tax=Mycobacterium sp. E740 TaxID=1834149 RepID=UPI0007FE63E1|nr:hypothetical protein [Mycobacterium sp. E740]OBI84481.1 hypothetical protein A5663_11270 [Mycobacterium sp. E740]